MEDYTILLEYSYIQYFWQLWIFHYHTIFTFITELHKMKHRNYFGSLHVYFIFCNIWKKNEYALLSQNEKKPSLHLITKVYLLMVIELEIWRIDSIHSKWSLFCVYLSLNYYIKFCCLIYINATFNQFI